MHIYRFPSCSILIVGSSRKSACDSIRVQAWSGQMWATYWGLGLVLAAECLPVLIVTGVVFGVIGGANEIVHGAAREDPWRVASGTFAIATSAAGGVSQWLQNVRHVKYAGKAVKAANAAKKAGATVGKAKQAAKMTTSAAKALKQANVVEKINKGISATQSCVTGAKKVVKDTPAAAEGLLQGNCSKALDVAAGVAVGALSVAAAASQCGGSSEPWSHAVGKADIAKDARIKVREIAQVTRQKGPNPSFNIGGHETKSLDKVPHGVRKLWWKQLLELRKPTTRSLTTVTLNLQLF